MADTISAPDHDRCAIEGCNRPESDPVHPATFDARSRGDSYSHRFVAKTQLSSTRPPRRDPLKEVRPMTDTERAGARLAGFTPTSAARMTIVKPKPSAPAVDMTKSACRARAGEAVRALLIRHQHATCAEIAEKILSMHGGVVPLNVMIRIARPFRHDITGNAMSAGLRALRKAGKARRTGRGMWRWIGTEDQIPRSGIGEAKSGEDVDDEASAQRRTARTRITAPFGPRQADVHARRNESESSQRHIPAGPVAPETKSMLAVRDNGERYSQKREGRQIAAGENSEDVGIRQHDPQLTQRAAATPRTAQSSDPDHQRWCRDHGPWNDTTTSMCPHCMEARPTEPPLRTEAQIVDAFVKALQTIGIAKVIVGDIGLKTQKNIAGEILTAKISGDVSLIFRGEGA